MHGAPSGLFALARSDRLIALTEVDDEMRAFLNQEKAPQICSFQTKVVFVSRFGLALHDKEYFYNEVFVGKGW